MKTMLAIVIATSLLAGIFGAATWTEDIAGISFAASTIMSTILGAIVGTIIGAVTLLILKVIK